MRAFGRVSCLIIFGASLGGTACRDASAPVPEPPLAPGTFESSLSGGLVETLVGSARHITYPGGGPFFLYLTDTTTPTGLGKGGIVLERLAGAPVATGAFPAQLWIAAASGPPQNFSVSSFLMVAGAATGVDFTTLSGTITIDSVGAEVLVGRLEVQGPASLAGSGAAPAQVVMRARFRSRPFP